MKTALLVIDMIDGIMTSGSCREFCQQAPVLKKINQLIALFRQRDWPIYFIRLAFNDNYPDIPEYSKIFNFIKQNKKFRLDQPDSNWVSGLDINKDSDRVFNKTATSPFHHSGLMDAIKQDQVSHLVFTGLATDNAINVGARVAHDEGFYTTVIADACGANTLEFHENALTLLQKIVNAVVTTETFVAGLHD